LTDSDSLKPVKIEKILQTPTFKKAIRKLKRQDKLEVDAAIKAIMIDPEIGELKKGDLCFLRVHKFKMNKQLTLLGYRWEDGSIVLELLNFGSHENYYRDSNKLFN
jgi:mRNA interferase YafQ